MAAKSRRPSDLTHPSGGETIASPPRSLIRRNDRVDHLPAHRITYRAVASQVWTRLWMLRICIFRAQTRRGSELPLLILRLANPNAARSHLVPHQAPTSIRNVDTRSVQPQRADHTVWARTPGTSGARERHICADLSIIGGRRGGSRSVLLGPPEYLAYPGFQCTFLCNGAQRTAIITRFGNFGQTPPTRPAVPPAFTETYHGYRTRGTPSKGHT